MRSPAAVIERHARVIGVACGSGAQDHGCADGPEALRAFGFFRDLEEIPGRLRWDSTIRCAAESGGDSLAAVAKVADQLSRCVVRTLDEGDFPLVIGGDHSCAIGTWSGVYGHLTAGARLGLLWVDAHMDSHTVKTSLSHAVHGMPLAALLGQGDAQLTQVMTAAPKVLPQDVCLIGVRSFEWGEAALLRTLGVRVYFMNEVRERGLPEVWREAVAHVRRNTIGYGISLDLDALDPTEEAGVGSPVPGGLHKPELLDALKSVHADSNLLALEIVEYNPHRDRNFETAKAVHDLCLSLLE